MEKNKERCTFFLPIKILKALDVVQLTSKINKSNQIEMALARFFTASFRSEMEEYGLDFQSEKKDIEKIIKRKYLNKPEVRERIANYYRKRYKTDSNFRDKQKSRVRKSQLLKK